mgnify:CR=1 FL=1
MFNLASLHFKAILRAEDSLKSSTSGLYAIPMSAIVGLKELFYASKSGDSKPPKCLTVVPEIQWRPRVPTSYVSSIFTIESKIIPELKDLIKVANDPNSLMADDLISESTKIPQVLKVKEVCAEVGTNVEEGSLVLVVDHA